MSRSGSSSGSSSAGVDPVREPTREKWFSNWVTGRAKKDAEEEAKRYAIWGAGAPPATTAPHNNLSFPPSFEFFRYSTISLDLARAIGQQVSGREPDPSTGKINVTREDLAAIRESWQNHQQPANAEAAGGGGGGDTRVEAPQEPLSYGLTPAGQPTSFYVSEHGRQKMHTQLANQKFVAHQVDLAHRAILREKIKACVQAEGVNSRAVCRPLAIRYLSKLAKKNYMEFQFMYDELANKATVPDGVTANAYTAAAAAARASGSASDS